uniref:Uncharacterized protein LOC111111667 n=1 Tax=Crassostrea virginica TaxID=6565 RepID=A0A8B8BMC5_CRAVI|nr:uncharacterized protein LOC111111667 [Crassostrea virginica]
MTQSSAPPLTMDPRHSAQDVVRCVLCRDAVAPMYCNVCHTHLCGDCVAKHFSDKSKVHTVVPLEQFLSTLSYPKCPTHPTKQCELHCEQCDIPICSSCISSGKHIGHKAVDIFEDFESKKEVLRKDLEELEKSILPKYHESAAIIKTQKTDQHKHSQKLTAELNKQGEALHREINTIIQRKQAEINNINAQHLAAIEKQEAVINKALHEIKQVIVHLKSLLETSDVSHVSKYKSRNGDFRKLPPKLEISPPNFQPQRIDTEQLLKQFGSLSFLSIETEEQGYTVLSPGAESSPPARPLLDVPRLIADIPTSGYLQLYNTQKTDQHKHNQKLTSELDKRGEALHRDINTIIQRKQAEIDEMNARHLTAIEKKETEINKAIHEIKQAIVHLKSLLETSDVRHVSEYKSRNGNFRKLPPKLKISLPNFQPQRIDTEQLLKQFESLGSSSIEIEEQDHTMPSPEEESSSPARQLLDVPQLVTDIPTSGYAELYNMAYLSDEEIWTSGDNKIMNLYNLNGEVLKSVQTKSGYDPRDIAITQNGGLVYTDGSSIYLVGGTQIQSLITLPGWSFLGLCSISSGDLLVIMISDDWKETKVVRYSGSTEKQSIQLDDGGKPLFSSCGIKYLSENRNLDICVADNYAGAVVVVSAAGKLRFRFTSPPSTALAAFRPFGITTDSQGNILTSDNNNHRIHIIDQDGDYLYLINNCGLYRPFGLCVDSQDNLLVAEMTTRKVKKIMYYKISSAPPLTMDPRYSAQDVVRCALCRDAVAPLYCNVCHTHLCGDCVAKHFSDKSKIHNVVPLEQFLSTLNYPKCPTHPTKQCELHCEQCDIPICSSCISSGKHIGHKAVDIFEDLESKKEVLRKDLEELENSIFPKYQESAAIIKTQKTDQHKHSQKLTSELTKQGEALHREINTIIQRKQAEIDEMNAQHLAAIEQQEAVINKALHEIKQVIVHLKSLLETSDVGHVSKYKSRNGDFRKLPPKLKISLPNFQPQRIDTEQLLKQFGSLSRLFIETEEQGYTVPSPGAESSPPARSLLDVPRLITDIHTGYDYLYNVSCLSDEEIWTSGGDKIMKLYNLKGELLKSVQTKSGDRPQDIAVTRSGGLVYADYHDSSINLVSGTQIQTLITLRGWRPRYLCSTSSGDLLVTMTSDDGKQSKVVRYSGSTEKQTIQWDDQGKPLYSFYGIKYLSENRNLDICVADYDARAVVVVSAAGKLRFRYTGPPSTPGESLYPFGITTDSQANILTSDYDNNRIHIIDQDGHFLRFIHNCGLQEPGGLCVDSRDDLFVAEVDTGKVKKIMYYK